MKLFIFIVVKKRNDCKILKKNVWELLKECIQDIKHDTCNSEYFCENFLNKNLTKFNIKYKILQKFHQACDINIVKSLF